MKIPRELTLAPGWALTQLWIAFRGQSFILMHTGRVGSVVVGELLRDQAEIVFDHDPLNHRRQAWAARYGLNTPWREDPRWEIMRRPWRARGGVYGAVVKPTDFEDSLLTWSQMLVYLDRALHPKRVAMTRRNLLRQIISGCRALENSQWHIYGQQPALSNKLQSHPDRLPRWLGREYTLIEALEMREKNTAMVVAAADEAGSNGLHLIYEDHVEAEPRVGYSLICKLLGLSPNPAARPKLTRTGNQLVRDLLARPEEWQAALRGTRWEWMLDA